MGETGVSKKQSTPKFPKNKHFLPPDTHREVCVSAGKKCCFLETPVLRFALLRYYRQYASVFYISYSDQQKL